MAGTTTTTQNNSAATGPTVQPFMPGFENALAQQLQAGYGGTLNDYLGHMSSVYKPMQMPGSNTVQAPKSSAVDPRLQPLFDSLGALGPMLSNLQGR